MKTSYREQGLDTLRAAAIVLVILFHLGWKFPAALRPIDHCGWIGVDLFFVLSGYLIGTQLLKPLTESKPLQIRCFLSRRAYRILPAYLATLALYRFLPIWREQAGLSPLWHFLTFTLNLLIDNERNLAFSHAWSLCVEEHFYLLLPLAVLLLSRRPAAWKSITLIAAVLVFGVLVRLWLLHHRLQTLPVDDDYGIRYIKRVYYPTWARLDGLLAGVTLACIRLFRPAWWDRVASRGQALFAGGAVLSLFSLGLFLNRFSSATGVAAVGTVVGFPLLSLGLGLIVASALTRNGWLSRVRIPGARLLATLAFSLYLTHKAAAHLTELAFPAITEAHGPASYLLFIAAILLIASAMYLCVERPFLHLRDRYRSPEIEARLDPAL